MLADITFRIEKDEKLLNKKFKILDFFLKRRDLVLVLRSEDDNTVIPSINIPKGTTVSFEEKENDQKC